MSPLTAFSNLPAGRLPGLAGGLITLAAVAILAVSAAQLVWMLVAGPGAHIRIAPPAASPSTSGANLDFSILSRVTPFRSQAASPAPGATESAPLDESGFMDVEETTLDLRLHGLIRENEDGGHAFISTDGGIQKAYAVGEELDGTRGVTLERILTDSVLLRRDGELESLTYADGEDAIVTLSAVNSLDPEGDDAGDAAETNGDGRPATQAIARAGEENAGEQSASEAGAARAGPGQRNAALAGGDGEVPGAAPGAAQVRARDGAPVGAQDGAQDTAADRPALPTIVRRLTREDLETLALSIRLEENQSTGDGGLYVFPTGNIDVFAKSGLEAGDIITDVAGLKLDSRADFDRLLQEVEQQRQISLEIIRGQDTRSLRVTIID